MQVTEKLTRPLTEAKYLNTDNADRYRSIMRIFYENYEKLRYWMYQEEVYEEMTADPYFADYRMEQCQQDLAMLTEWKNLNTIQDTRRVSSIEEFKNKKFRYQMSEYSVEIERLVIRLEKTLDKSIARRNRTIQTTTVRSWILETLFKRLFTGVMKAATQPVTADRE